MLFFLIFLFNQFKSKKIKFNIMDINLEIDYSIYKKCISRTNIVQCGRNKSIIHKHNKPPTNYRKGFILPLTECKIISTTLKMCNENRVIVLIGIASGPDYFYERYVYRLYYNKFKYVKYYFFMGLSENKYINKKIYKENEIYKDIIIFSFVSSYYNLTTQIVCTLKWVSSHCSNYKWYIHQTSDTFLNINRIFHFLKKQIECKCVIGYIFRNMQVDRVKNNTFYIPYNIYNYKIYPPYPNGPGYIVHKSAINEINKRINISNPKVWIDDVYIGIVISNTNISLVNIKTHCHMFGFINNKNLNRYFIIHNLSPSEIYFLVKSIT